MSMPYGDTDSHISASCATLGITLPEGHGIPTESRLPAIHPFPVPISNPEHNLQINWVEERR